MELRTIEISGYLAFAEAEKARDSVSSEDRARFSAHPNFVPAGFYGRFPSASEESLYKPYLSCKYSYFIHCIDGTQYNEWNSPAAEEYRSLTDYWSDEVQTNEACVYLLRLNQFGREALCEWYSDEIDEFVAWAELITTRNFLDDHDYSDDIESYTFSLKELDMVQSIENEVSKKFIELMESNKSNESEYLFEFLRILQLKSGAKVCDFLYVDFENSEVDFELASLELSASDRDDLASEESYHERIGITGSILVPCARKHLHVGTNNLSGDPRQAKRQNENYTRIYKLQDEIKSFWVFPIRDFNNTIVAAFRVVEKEDGTVWSYPERFSLLAIAEWFSHFWAYTRHMLQAHNVDDVRKVTFKCCKEECKDCLGSISKDVLKRVLEHLRSVAYRKVENHNIGASILIVPDQSSIEGVSTVIPKYPMSFDLASADIENELEYLSLSYKGINPKSAMFVYDNELKFIGLYLFRDDSENFEKGVQTIGRTIPQSILFTSVGGAYSIRMYRSMKMVADYYHSESKGIWRFRCIKEVRKACDQILLKSSLKPELIDKILEISLDLSYDKNGAMIVVCDDENLESKLTDGKRAIGNIGYSNINSLNNNQIRDYATMDGAIVLAVDGTIREIGVILPVDEIIDDAACAYRDKYEQWCEWKVELAKKQKGSRHTTAVKFSLQHADACVFVVSENRGISIFYDGKAVLWDDEIGK